VDLSSHNANPPSVFEGEAVPAQTICPIEIMALEGDTRLASSSWV
jgi:hypothetical protein